MASVFIRRAAGWRVAGLLLLLFASQADATRRFTELGAGRGLDVNVAVSMLVDRDGLLWVGSREGLFRYDGYQATAFLPDPERTGSISDQDIRSLHQTDDGALWVSTNTGGLNRRDPQTGQFTQFHHDSRNPRSLSDESIYGVAQDATGRVWVGTQNGLNRLDAEGRNFVRYFHDSGTAASLAHNWVYALHRGHRGSCGSARSEVASTAGMTRAGGSSISRSRRSSTAPAGSTTCLPCTRRPMAGCGPERATGWSYSIPRSARQSASTSPTTRARNRSSPRCTRISTGACGSPRWRTVCWSSTWRRASRRVRTLAASALPATCRRNRS